MSTSALVLMLTVWGFIGFLTIRFFLIILKKGVDGSEGEEG